MTDNAPRRWYAAASLLHNAYTAWVVLLLSLVVTIGAYFVSSSFIEQRQRDRFLFSAEELEKAIKSHLSVYEQVLRASVAMVYASDELTRSQFAIYVQSLQLNEYWPGIQGIGYSIPLRPEELASHVESIRNEGFPEYQIKPPGEREQYSSIIYLEPFDWRNRRAFGYDMYSNDVRRQAMDRARRTGLASTSGKITLVQETNQDVQSGFLTYLPVYKTKSTPATEEQREAQFAGWIYAAFRAGDLMAGVTGGEAFKLEFDIYDGSSVVPELLLYSSHGSHHAATQTGSLVLVRELELQGRPWTLRVMPADDFARTVNQADLPRYVAAGGIVIDLLLFYVILSLHFIKQKAEHLVAERTRELRLAQRQVEQERSFANAVIDSLPLVVLIKKRGSDEVSRVNPYTRALFGEYRHGGGGLLRRFVQRIENQSRLAGVDSRCAFMGQLEAETESGRRWFVVNRNNLELAAAESEPEYSLCSAIDITERVESENRFTTLFDAAPCGLMLVASDQSIQLANKALCDAFGYEPEELVGQSVSVLIPKDIRSHHDKLMMDFTHEPGQRKMSTRKDLRGLNKSGRELILDIALQPLPYEDRNSVLVSVFDITEQHNLVCELERANRYKSEFLASMSHELRTPLNSIIGFTERVVKGAGETLRERELDALNTVKRNANQLLALINDILDLSKVEAGRMELDWARHDICKLVDVQCQALAPSAKAKGLDFTVTTPADPIIIWTDKPKLIQILNNLVSNGVKYTRKGSVDVCLKWSAEKSVVVLEVTDTGIGIPEVELRSLFKEFVRMKEAREHSIQGTGLGLVISARLVRLMGGTIKAESVHGEGSRFTVSLPVQAPDAALTDGDGVAGPG